MPIKTVLFDIGGVLEINADTGWQAKWEAVLAMTFEDLFGRLEQAGLNASLGTCSEAAWLEGLREHGGMSQAQLDGFIHDFWVWYLGEPNTELIAYFAGLRSRYQTAILSNSALGARAREQARYGFEDITDLIVYSHEVGLQKPDPRMYALTCERLGVQPSEIVLLDDLEANVTAARAFGMNAVLFQNNVQAMAEIEALLREV